METARVIVKNEVGLHARPAALLQQQASKFSSDVRIGKNDKFCSAKSIMGILSMGACKGDEITVIASGDDEKEAIEAIIQLIKSLTE